MLPGVLLQSMFGERLVDLVLRDEWLFQFSKTCMARAFTGVTLSYCLFVALFNLRWTTNKGRKKTASMIFDIIFFCNDHFVSCCPWLVLFSVFFFLTNIRHEMPF